MEYAELAEQPASTEIKMAGGVFVKSCCVAKSGTYIPQHSHRYDHISYVASGRVRAWADGNLLGDFSAPVGIVIVAETKHLFMTLEDATVILCIHNIGNAEAPEVTQEHQIVRGAQCPGV